MRVSSRNLIPIGGSTRRARGVCVAIESHNVRTRYVRSKKLRVNNTFLNNQTSEDKGLLRTCWVSDLCNANTRHNSIDSRIGRDGDDKDVTIRILQWKTKPAPGFGYPVLGRGKNVLTTFCITSRMCDTIVSVLFQSGMYTRRKIENILSIKPKTVQRCFSLKSY